LTLTNPTKNSLHLLLARLDADLVKAAEKYEDLRLRLVNYFAWSCGCPESRADDLADQTLDRVALKLEQETVIENLRAYSLATARFVWLEHGRKVRESGWGDHPPDIPAGAREDEERDERYLCLESCLGEAIKHQSDRDLILDYYDAAEGEKNKNHRKKLAQRLGIDAGALKVRACRLRKSLEKCIRECLEKRAEVVTK
jgi:DNA-directed RNA polymerase specialized sigma24 family protein